MRRFFLKKFGYIPLPTFEYSDYCFKSIKGEEDGLPYVKLYLCNIRDWTYDQFLFQIMYSISVSDDNCYFECVFEAEKEFKRIIIDKCKKILALLLFSCLIGITDMSMICVTLFNFFSAISMLRCVKTIQKKYRIYHKKMSLIYRLYFQ